MIEENKASAVSRRGVLLGGAVLGASYLLASPMVSFADSPGGKELLTRFMHLSQLLVNHRLDAGVGARMYAWAAKEHADLAAMVDGIVGIAEKKQARVVEDFFADIPAGPQQDFAHWVVFAWYTGSSSAKPTAKVFAYEQALTFQTTADVVTIPSFGIAGPNQWRHETVSLSPMPVF